MRVDDELLDILRDFRQKAVEAGITQLFVQTHFQSPLEVTPESREAIRRILSTGWAVTNQLVYNVAASRRGHTAKLRKVLNSLGVICYYTFTVKGFEENYEVFAPNARSLQESAEEKAWGRLAPEAEHDFLESLDVHRTRLWPSGSFVPRTTCLSWLRIVVCSICPVSAKVCLSLWWEWTPKDAASCGSTTTALVGTAR